MKKGIIWTLIILFIILGLIYTLLFTPPGNKIVKSIIEKRLNSKIPIRVKVENFKLTLSYFSIKITLKDNSFVEADGYYSIFSKSINAKYKINVLNLKNFAKLIGYEFNGGFFTEGYCNGNRNLLKISGNARFAESNLSYEVILRNGEVSDLAVNSKKIKIKELLHFVNLPGYADGIISISGNIKNLTTGNILIKLSKGILFAKVLNKEFDLSLKKNITFYGTIRNKLRKGNILISDVNIFTSIGIITLPGLKIDYKNATIAGNYILNLPDLVKLYDIISTKLRGKIILKGKLKKTPENLYLDGYSKIFSGDMNFQLNDHLFNLNLIKINTSRILYMLYYPEMFDSIGGGNLRYNIEKKIGNFDFKFTDGRLIKSKLTFIPRTVVGLIKLFTGVDLTKELFKIVNLNGNISKSVITSNLYLKSKLAEISSKNAVIDYLRKNIKALFNIKIGGVKFSILISGNLNKPSIKLNPGKSVIKEPNFNNVNKKVKELKHKFKSFFH